LTILAATASGVFAVDLETEEVEPAAAFEPAAPPSLNLPRVVAAAEAGSTVVVVVDARPPMLVSHDAGTTWRESGRGLPPGAAVAVAGWDPDLLVYAGRNRLYVSRNGGVFWTALSVELPEIRSLALRATES
jgi:hypothetical protein